MQTQNALSWFEIPADDLARATQFYSKALGHTLRQETLGPNTLAIFPYQQPGVGGCLIHGENYVPGKQGSVVYLSVTAELNQVLDRVANAGGKVVLGKTKLPGDMGCYAHIIDSEGNRVGLHTL
jgi:predicted enzyme related to lactoylglutathione lyase